MEIKKKAMELEIRLPKKEQLGDLYIGQSGIEWCVGRTTKGNGIKRSWEELFEWFNPEKK